MGCNKRLPYGAASLEHFLNASRVLMPHNRNVFMMTDDPKWLKAEVCLVVSIHTTCSTNTRRMRCTSSSRPSDPTTAATATTHPSTCVPPSPSPGNAKVRRSYLILDPFMHFLSYRHHPNIAIALAVVGHLGSAAFNFIYRNLCFYHDNQFLKCPPRFSIGGP